MPSGQVGTGYATTLQSNGGQSPVQWSVTGGNLPPGINLAASGAISGTTSAAGNFTFTAQASDSGQQKVTRQFNLTVITAGLAITTTSLPNATLSTAYSTPIQTSNAIGAVTFALTSGTLPAGLTLSSAGVISGTPTVLTSSTFTVSATDTSPTTVSRQFTLVVSPTPLTITTNTLAAGPVATAYTATLAASGGVTPYTWSIAAGALPAGLSLAANGTISGTPTTPGTATFTALVSDTSGQSQGRQFSITIAPTALSITTTSLANGTAGSAYTDQVFTSGGFGAVTLSVSAGALPAGLTMAANGTISGTPSVVGDFPFTVTATDAAAQNVSRGLSIHIAATTLVISSSSLPNGTVSTAYTTSLAASGGVAPYSWTVTGGALPTGLSLATSGSISGTPSAPGTALFTATVSDNSGQQQSHQFSITVDPQPLVITTASLTSGILGTAYSAQVQTSGGFGAISISLSSGTLPTGLSMASNGTISGTPSAIGDFPFTVTAIDGAAQSVSRNLTIHIAATALAITSSTLPNGTVSVAYATALTASGGVTPYNWSVTAGALPTGLVLAANGGISGTPTTPGAFVFTATVTDGSSQQQSHQFSITINPPVLSITTSSLASGTAGTPYSDQVLTTGGFGAVTLSVTSGVLPTGLSMAANGTISGTPTAVGDFPFTATATDAAAQSVSHNLTIHIAATTLVITSSTLPNGTVSTAYSTTLTASGGLAPYNWTVTAGALPAGLALSTGGNISGTPTAPGTFVFTATVNDGSSQQQSHQFSITINPPALMITTASLPSGVSGTAYSTQVLTSGGFGTITLALASGSLPTGLSIATDGTISGTPSSVGDFNFVVSASDQASQVVTRSLSIHIAASSLVITTIGLPAGSVGVAYSNPVSASGGLTPYTWSLAAGALPAGLLISPAGVISGTPTASGTASFTVQVADNSAQIQTKALNLTINASTIDVAPLSLSDATQNVAYSATISASGGTSPYSFAVIAGALPAGLTLSSGGTLAGTPTTLGSFSFTIQATDSFAQTGSRAYTVTVNPSPLQITTASLPGGTASQSYTTGLASTGGTLPVTWSISAGALPAGLTLSSSGTLSGTPTTAGTSTFTVQVADSAAQTATHQFSVTINPAPLALSTSSLPSGQAGTAYVTSLVSTGGTTPYSYSITAGALPGGLTLSTGGSITGTPSAAGSFGVTIRVTDAAAQTAQRAFTLVVNPPPLQITTASLPSGTATQAYSASMAFSGGTAPVSWSISAGALPAGVTMNSAGVFSGTPTSAGSSTFTVKATDSGTQTATQQYSVTINPAPLVLSTSSLATGQAGTAYSATLVSTGGTLPYSYSVIAGALPGGVTLSTSGSISGTPSAAGSFGVTIRVTDAAAQTAQRAFTLVVNPPPLQITTASLPGGTVTQAYNASMSFSGGTAPVTWSISAGALPAGVTMSGAGVFSGTPTSAGSSTFTVKATDSGAQTATQQYSVTINPAPLVLSTSSLPAGQVGTAYSTTLASTGGTLPYSYSVMAGALPGGITLSSSGTISGTPTAAGSFGVTIRVTDAAAQTAQRLFTLTVQPPTLQITTASLPGGTVGTAYSASMSFSGGTAPVTWSISAGTLPAGVTMSGAGVFSGTPTTAATKTFTVKAMDSGAQTATQQYSVTINPSPLVLSTTSLPSAQSGVAYSTTLVSTGGTTPYTYSIITGSLPTGITLSSGGVISGTSSTFGTFNVTIGVADAGSQTAQRAFALTVQAPALSISTAALPDTVQNQAYSQAMAASGGAAPLTWSIASGTLPTGISMSSAGAITGSGTAVGAFTFTVQVTDNAAQVATRQFTVNVTATALSLTTNSLPPATVNSAYSGTLAASGGVLPYTWSLVSGTLPSGAGLNSSGSISGIPTVTGTFNFTVQVQDNSAQTAQRALSLVVQPPPLLITTNTLAVGSAGQPYSQTMTASGGTPPYAWSIAAGALPTGISFSTAGAFSGTPTANASYPLTIRATDSLGATATKDFTLNIAPAFRFTITSIWGGIVNQPYSFTFAIADAPSAVTFAVSAGTLPPGLTFSTSTGVLSGTPTTAGQFTFTVQATSLGQTISYSNYMIISPNDTLYGANTGDTYADEGGGPNPSATLVSACGTLGVGSFRLTQSVSAATPGTTCFVIGGKTILDLNGNTVTGRITSNTTITNESVFNGLVNCNWIDNGGDAGCILFIGEANLGNALRFHHLTVNNAAQFGRAIHVDWSPGTAVNASVSVHHLTVIVPSQPNVSRSFAVSVISKGNHVEGYSNDLTCVADANACQTIMCFGTADCKLHHNKMTMQQNTTVETGRAMILDGGVLNGEVWNNNIITNNNRAVRVRDSSNIRIHDNILGPVTAVNTAAIHLADPDAGVNDLNVTVDNNTIAAQGGIVVFIRNGIDAFIRNNHVTCAGCSNSFATVRTGTQTEITISDNPDVLLNWPSPQIFVEGPNGKATLCNSGSAFGSGIIVPIFTTPCP